MDIISHFLSELYHTFSVSILIVYTAWLFYVVEEFTIHYYESVHGLIEKREIAERNYYSPLFIWGLSAIVIYHIRVFSGESLHPIVSNHIALYIGLIILGVGLYCAILGRIHAGGLRGPHLYYYKVKDAFPRNGIYASIRHPIEMGQCLMAVGSFIVVNSWLLVFFPLVIILFSVARGMRIDRFYEETEKDSYIEYKKKTGFMIPINN